MSRIDPVVQRPNSGIRANARLLPCLGGTKSWWTVAKQLLGARPAHLVLGILFVSMFVGCVPATPEWKQGPAVELPDTAATVDALELVVDEADGTLVLSARCTAEATYRSVTIEASVNDDVTSSTAEARSEDEPIICEPDRVVLRSMVDQIADVPVGETVEVGLSIQPTSGYRGVVAETHLYMMGTDGKLRSGAGSVWR